MEDPTTSTNPAVLANLLSNALRDVADLKARLADAERRAAKAERLLRTVAPNASASSSSSSPTDIVAALSDADDRADRAEARLRELADAWGTAERALSALDIKAADARAAFARALASPQTTPTAELNINPNLNLPRHGIALVQRAPAGALAHPSRSTAAIAVPASRAPTLVAAAPSFATLPPPPVPNPNAQPQSQASQSQSQAQSSQPQLLHAHMPRPSSSSTMSVLSDAASASAPNSKKRDRASRARFSDSPPPSGSDSASHSGGARKRRRSSSIGSEASLDELILASLPADTPRRQCKQCGQPGRYKEGKCVEKWGPGPAGPGTVCDRCRKKMKRVERRAHDAVLGHARTGSTGSDTPAAKTPPPAPHAAATTPVPAPAPVVAAVGPGMPAAPRFAYEPPTSSVRDAPPPVTRSPTLPSIASWRETLEPPVSSVRSGASFERERYGARGGFGGYGAGSPPIATINGEGRWLKTEEVS